LPGGALIVDFIDGRAPRLPDELELMADTLARLHALPLPPASAPIPRQANPFLATLEAIELNALRFLDKAVPDSGARAEIAEELRAMRGMALALGRRTQPLTVALADTHPGNFIVAHGIAWFVDLEKVHVGSPAIDLAHATLPTSTLWHPDVGTLLTRAEVERFHESYLGRIAPTSAVGLRPWLIPMRRLTWLRTDPVHGALAGRDAVAARPVEPHPMERCGAGPQDEASHRRSHRLLLRSREHPHHAQRMAALAA
jgi:hypothetical protein